MSLSKDRAKSFRRSIGCKHKKGPSETKRRHQNPSVLKPRRLKAFRSNKLLLEESLHLLFRYGETRQVIAVEKEGKSCVIKEWQKAQDMKLHL